MIASLILIFHLLGVMDAEAASNFLLLTGVLLLFSEFFVPSFGMITLNGVIALFVGYVLRTGDSVVWGIPIDWSLFFGVAVIELGLIAAIVVIYMRFRNRVATTGSESMVGEEAEVLEWSGKKGRVRAQSEIWNARGDENFQAGDTAIVEDVKQLKLFIKKKE